MNRARAEAGEEKHPVPKQTLGTSSLEFFVFAAEGFNLSYY